MLINVMLIKKHVDIILQSFQAEKVNQIAVCYENLLIALIFNILFERRAIETFTKNCRLKTLNSMSQNKGCRVLFLGNLTRRWLHSFSAASYPMFLYNWQWSHFRPASKSKLALNFCHRFRNNHNSLTNFKIGRISCRIRSRPQLASIISNFLVL